MAKHGSCVSRRYLRIRRTLGSVRCASKDRPDLQWCLAPDMIKPALLGRNGHPRSGIIRPNLGLRRRMWAGGRVEWHCGMFPGESITQNSKICDLTYKKGRAGRLGFVTREHQYFCDDELRVDEVQNIVFHVESSADALPVSPPLVAAWLMLKPDK